MITLVDARRCWTSRCRGSGYVSTEHILLALLCKRQSLAVKLLKEYEYDWL